MDQSSRPWKELLSKVRNQTPYLPSLPQHTNTHRSLCEVLGQPPLSSAEASLCCGEAGRKKKRAREARWEGGRPFPSSHRPPRAFYFFRWLLFWWGYLAGVSAEERGQPLYYFQALLVVAFAECQRKKKNLPTSPVLVPMFIKPFNFSCWGENFHYKYSSFLHFCHALGLKIALILLPIKTFLNLKLYNFIG